MGRELKGRASGVSNMEEMGAHLGHKEETEKLASEEGELGGVGPDDGQHAGLVLRVVAGGSNVVAACLGQEHEAGLHGDHGL